MSLTLSAIVVAAIAAAVSQVGAVTVYTPASVVACLPVQLSWVDGQAPYYLSILPGGQPEATPLQDLGEQSGNSLSWKPNFPAGTEVTIQIRDGVGVINYSGLVKIQAGTTTCAPTSAVPTHVPTPHANATAHTIATPPINKQPGIPHPSNSTAAGAPVGVPANHTTGINGTIGLNSTGLSNSTTTLGGLSSTGQLGGFNSTSTGITSTASTFNTPTTPNTKSFNDDDDDEDLDSGASRTSVGIMAVLVAGVVTFLL